MKLRSQEDDLQQSIETIERLEYSIQELSYHTPIIQEQLEDLQQQIRLLIWKAEEVDFTYHWIVEFKDIKIENAFMKAKLFIYSQKVRKNQVE